LVAALALGGRLRLWFAAAAVVTIAYGLLEPTGLLPYGAVWLLGAAVAQKGRGARQTIVAIVAVAGVLVLPLLIDKPVAKYDTIGAFLVAGSLMLMARAKYFPEPVAKISAWGAGFSFSLYMAHAPVLSVLGTAGHIGPDGSPASYAILSGASLIFAYLFYLVFERRTPWVRRVLSEAFVPKAAPPRTDIDTPVGVSVELEDVSLDGSGPAPTTPS
jgi:peptidoglycan/LPS O-acetylase OafA/YrhL